MLVLAANILMQRDGGFADVIMRLKITYVTIM